MNAPSKNNAAGFNMGKLPSIPHALLKLIEACHKVDVSFEELSGIIKKDASLSSKVVAVANSPLYAQWRDAKDFNRLLVVLGLKTIKTIAITSAVHQFFSEFDGKAACFIARFWQTSLACAYSAKALAQLTGYESEDEAYLAGLLHTIGQLVLLRESPEHYSALLQSSKTDSGLDVGERELFGTTSAEVGAMLIDNWGLDSFFSDAILYQREPAESVLDTPRLVKLINFSHKLSEKGGDPIKLFSDADLLFGLTQPLLEDLLNDVDQQVHVATKAMGVKFAPELESGGGSAADAAFLAENERAKLALAGQVRNIALLDGARQNMGDDGDLDSTLQAILLDLNILFGVSQSLCFLCDPETSRLLVACSSLAKNEREEEFTIPLEAGRSLVAEAVLQRSQLSSLDVSNGAPLSVVDQQLIKFLGGEGLLCVPLTTKQQDIGVLVIGVGSEKSSELLNKFNLMTYFATEAAQAISRCNQLISMQQQLLESEQERQLKHIKMVVHEANNPLGIINNYLEILSAEFGDDKVTQLRFSILKEEIERVAGILLRFRDEPRTEEEPKGEVDLNALIQDLFSLFRLSLFTTHSIQDELGLDDSIPLLPGNRNSLKQILTNLVKNAVEAMPEGGSIFLGTRGQVNVNGTLFVELTLSDSGPGMPGNVLKRLFSPITSTKGKEHSGLGLTIVKKLVTDLDGTISCRSIENKGTEFRILLPQK